VSASLYAAITEHLGRSGEPLAARRGYQMAWRRAVQAAGGRAAGSHGLRRLSTREFYSLQYARGVEGGNAPGDARRTAREEAVERLGHSRNRSDQAACYLDPAA